MVIDRELDRFTRCIKEAVHNREAGQAMNRDEGSYQLSSRNGMFTTCQEPKELVPASSDEGLR